MITFNGVQLLEHLVHVPVKGYSVVLVPEIHENVLNLLFVQDITWLTGLELNYFLVLLADFPLQIFQLIQQGVVPFVFYLQLLFIPFYLALQLSGLISAAVIQLPDQSVDLTVFILLQKLILHLSLLVVDVDVEISVFL